MSCMWVDQMLPHEATKRLSSKFGPPQSAWEFMRPGDEGWPYIIGNSRRLSSKFASEMRVNKRCWVFVVKRDWEFQHLSTLINSAIILAPTIRYPHSVVNTALHVISADLTVQGRHAPSVPCTTANKPAPSIASTVVSKPTPPVASTVVNRPLNSSPKKKPTNASQ